MRDALRLIHSKNDRLSTAVNSAQLVREIIIRLQVHNKENPFPNREDEIRYFKYWGPRFYGRLFYYPKICDIEIARMHTTTDRFETFLKKEMQTIEDFYYRHEELCKMYYLKDTSLDDRIFIRNASENHFFDEVEKLMDQDFCVGCYFASRLYANQKLRRYLKHQLEAKKPLVTTESPQLTSIDANKETDLLLPDATFNIKNIDIVEQMWGIYVSKSIYVNGKPATRKYIMKMLERFYGREVPNWEQLYQSITERKKDKFAYHTRILTALNQDLDRLEQKPPLR
jgi:hypothetical protein